MADGSGLKTAKEAGASPASNPTPSVFGILLAFNVPTSSGLRKGRQLPLASAGFDPNGRHETNRVAAAS